MIEFKNRFQALRDDYGVPETPVLEFFANWLANLPGGDRRRLWLPNYEYTRLAGHWQHQTYGDFTKSIDTALAECGIDAATIEERQNKLREERDALGPEQLETAYMELIRATFPAFERLLGKGYLPRDLIA